MVHRRNRLPWVLVQSAAVLLFLLSGCAYWRDKEEPGQFSYKEPELPPLVQPETIPTHEYLRQTPSGRLYPLKAARIAIVALPDFRPGSDPKSYLRNQVTQSKSLGSSFLPLHFYLAPEGIVLEGQAIEYTGDLGGRRVADAILVGVMGDYDQPTSFMPPEQEMTLVQLCAWLCSQHSIEPSRIVPAAEISPDATPLGSNLMNWFGPTDTLRERVRKTLQKASEDAAKEKDSMFSQFRTKKERRSPEITEDF